MEDWLYGDGEEQTKSVYVAKLDELKKLGDPVEMRYTEEQRRPAEIQALSDMCNVFMAMARSDAKEYAHIDAAKKEKVLKECEAALGWISEKVTFQQQLQKHDDPVLVCEDICKKKNALERFCNPIMTEPPPPPPKEPAKAKEKSKEEPQQQGQANGTQPQGTEEPMDVDQDGAKPQASGTESAEAVPANNTAEPMVE